MHVYMYICIPLHVYTCAYICVCIFVHRLWVSGAVLRRVSRCHGCTFAFVCIFMRMHMCVCISICAFSYSECCVHFGTGVLGTSACAVVYVTNVFFDITYTSATHSLQDVHINVCAYIYAYACMCIWIRMCVYDMAWRVEASLLTFSICV